MIVDELWVDREDIRSAKLVQRELPELAQGDVRLRIDMFGLTSNNVSYAVAGDSIGYWGFYPAPDSWGKVPVWGCADVVESTCRELPVGERVWGFLPMASYVDLSPVRVSHEHFVDGAAHRQALPALYNGYRRTKADPPQLKSMEVERCLLFPLFITSFVLYDYLMDNAFFGAEQVIIGSVSSKTGFGLAQLLRQDTNVTQRIVGVTSPANVAFVERMGCCDQIVTYGSEEEVDESQPAAFIDMSGDAVLTSALHRHLGDRMVESCMVGATHWQNRGTHDDSLPGAKPTFFFAPGHIAKRDAEWGPGATMARAGEAGAEIARQLADELSVTWTRDGEGLKALWADLLANKIPGNRGQMVSLVK